MRRALVSAALALLAAGAAAGALAGWGVTRLPRPPFPAVAATKKAAPGTPRLVVVSSRPNEITDVAEWFARNDLALREYAVPDTFRLGPRLPRLPKRVPLTIPYHEARLARAIRERNVLLLLYGSTFPEARYVVCADPATFRFTCGLDFLRYGTPPAGGPFQGVLWAAEVGGVLYVGHSHLTYASSSRGRTAYLSAIDLRRRKLLWRNGPLLANSRSFEVVGNLIVTGYGFTAEPDFLYLLDRRDGKVLQRLSLPSAPEYIVRRGRQLFVRTYDHDVVVELRAG